MICPACRNELSAVIEFGIELQECSECGGIWFDDGELRRLKSHGEAAMTRLDEKVQPSGEPILNLSVSRTCPKCNCKLDRYRYNYSSSVLLDTCQRCGGVWVDDSELSQMVAFAQNERAMIEADGGKSLAAAAAMAQMTGDLAKAKQTAQRRIEGAKAVMQGAFGYGWAPAMGPNYEDLPDR